MPLNKYEVKFVDGTAKTIKAETWGPKEGFAYFTIRYDFHADIIFSCPMSKIESVELIK